MSSDNPSNSETNAEYKVSELFDKTDGTIAFRSSDNMIFHINPKYLEITTEGFPPSDFVSTPSSEAVSLAEKSDVLELLFQFTCPRVPPNLDGIGFSLVLEVAEAAEKYVVYNAITICTMRMKDFLPQEALRVFQFAGEYDHENLIDIVAPLLVHKPFSDVAYSIPSKLHFAWSMYREQWLQTLYHISFWATDVDLCHCYQSRDHNSRWKRRVWEVQNQIAINPPDILKFRQLLDETTLGTCQGYTHWLDEVDAEIKQMRDFRSFLAEHRGKAKFY
ncbi:hypothetical protein VKT23_007313 [Stygiomarasmius scandens]|uniref:BTB domain-containing protein n=1 Tax=Marasmiellus scandens TaxID=2682957 RepID=A0ABR1JKG1_9AGAR